ncbi:MAG: sensor domain-containing diguanylate cyclase [Aliarcobacter sp.]|nr:sensor domain-containing diguanylate cyclase [Aliarcobacter sp.]
MELSKIKLFSTIFLIFSSYVILGKLSISYITMPEGIAIVWLPNAIILSTFLLRPRSEWIWYIFTFLISEIIADLGSFTLIQALQFGFINVFEGLVSALLIQKFNKNTINFKNIKYLISFIIFALTLVPSFTAILGALVYVTQIQSQANFLEFWRVWFFGDSLGLLLLVPLIVLTSQNKSFYFKKTLKLESILMIVTTILLAFLIFSTELKLAILPSTPMIFLLIFMWITYRKGIMFSMNLAMSVICIVVYFTVHNQGPFSIFSATLNTLYLQEFIATLVVLILFFGVLLREIKEKNILLLRSNFKLKKLSKELEDRVKEKTKSLEDANEKLNFLATTDFLTEIYNRRYFEDSIKNEIEKAQRHGSNLSFIMFDIDFFKNINDNFGHKAGDEVIISLANLIKNNIRKIDIFSRIGGEEFAIVLPNTDMEKTKELAIKLKNLVENHTLAVENHKIKITISMGLATLNEETQNYDEIFKTADTNLYKAKEAGRNIIVS